MPPETKYPEEFFNINNPSAPWTAIQFRTQVLQDLKNADQWQSITINPSNYFDNLTIEDQGGVYQLQMNLFDKNFANLENLVVRSLFVTRTANKLVEDVETTADEDEYFQFYTSRTSSANLRIRIGYAQSDNATSYIDETDFNAPTWVDRITNEKPVIRSPWIYFQISGANFDLKPEGLRVNIKAFSIMNNFIQKARLVQRYAELKGTPKNVINNVVDNIKVAASAVGDTVELEFVGKEPLGYPDIAAGEGGEDSTEGYIEVMLGGEPVFTELPDGTRKLTRQYKTVRTLLNEICSRIRPILYDIDGKEIPPTYDTSEEATELNKENENIDKMSPYKWMVVEEKEKTIIRFYYQDPSEQIKTQKTIRTYPWFEFAGSIIKDLDIRSETDFAMLNLQIASVDSSSGELTLHLARPASESEQSGNNGTDSEVDFSLGRITEVNDAFNSDDFQALFVSDVYDTEGYQSTSGRISPNQAAVAMSRQIVYNLNRQVFKGTITLPGDPFYFFDGSLEPFKYLIKLIIKRPDYADTDGSVTQGGVSYMSGHYIIGKITHSVGTSGYETKLEVLKFPRKKE